MVSAWLNFREHGDYQVAALCGELDAVDSEAVGTELAKAVAVNPRVIIDMTGLEFIDCCALGVLARVRAQALRAGGDLLVAAPAPLIRRVITLTEMTACFPVRASAAEAADVAGWRGAHIREPRTAVTSPAAGGH